MLSVSGQSASCYPDQVLTESLYSDCPQTINALIFNAPITCTGVVNVINYYGLDDRRWYFDVYYITNSTLYKRSTSEVIAEMVGIQNKTLSTPVQVSTSTPCLPYIV